MITVVCFFVVTETSSASGGTRASVENALLEFLKEKKRMEKRKRKLVDAQTKKDLEILKLMRKMSKEMRRKS